MNSVLDASNWFRDHVTLFGQPYTLDDDQVRAAIDDHKNTLVTARAGSGKTRVIVAKVAYLVTHGLANLDEIAIFMFNRTAAAEVNQRIAEVKVDNIPLASISSASARDIAPASTFHKFALDLIQLAGERPEIISTEEHDALIAQLLQQTLDELHLKLSLKDQQELLGITNNFITRAGQYYPSRNGLQNLESQVSQYCAEHHNKPDFAKNIRFHQVSLDVYRRYLAALHAPKIDFNLLMATATELLLSSNCPDVLRRRIRPLKYILIDEYQDFSYLFFALVQAMRRITPEAHLFCVGDDWQAINRFAGSDVNYFINFAQFFPENIINIPLATNYRSDRCIVERANRYMLTNYNPEATPARAFSRKHGKIYHYNPNKIRFDRSDLAEDCLGDGQILLALSQATAGKIPLEKIPIGAAKLLKSVLRIIQRHPHNDIMLLHRHNFTSFDGITLEVFLQALHHLVPAQGIMPAIAFNQQVRCMTMHKSKGLESDIVILLEMNRDIIQSQHPHATIFQLFGDTREAEIADQQRLIYVALTRAKHKLYLLSTDQPPIL